MRLGRLLHPWEAVIPASWEMSMRQHMEMPGLVPETPATATECRKGFPTFLKLGACFSFPRQGLLLSNLNAYAEMESS